MNPADDYAVLRRRTEEEGETDEVALQLFRGAMERELRVQESVVCLDHASHVKTLLVARDMLLTGKMSTLPS